MLDPNLCDAHASCNLANSHVLRLIHQQCDNSYRQTSFIFVCGSGASAAERLRVLDALLQAEQARGILIGRIGVECIIAPAGRPAGADYQSIVLLKRRARHFCWYECCLSELARSDAFWHRSSEIDCQPPAVTNTNYSLRDLCVWIQVPRSLPCSLGCGSFFTS